jgi:hypothetical protein
MVLHVAFRNSEQTLNSWLGFAQLLLSKLQTETYTVRDFTMHCIIKRVLDT